MNTMARYSISDRYTSALWPRSARFLIGSALLLISAAFAVSLHAHAILLESSPALHATVAGPDLSIRLRFNVRVDVIRSRFTLVYPDTVARPLSLDKQTAPDTVLSHVSGLAPGSYTIRWQVLAPDGHISRGEIPFKVGT